MAITIQQIRPVAHLPLVLGVLRKLDVAALIDTLCPVRSKVNIRLTHGKKSAAEHHVITALGLIGQDVRVTLDTRSAPIGQANTTLVRFGGLPVEPSGTGFEVGQATW